MAEIAEQTGISRQGVHDTIARAEHILKEYELKTGIVSRFLKMQSDISSVEKDVLYLIDVSEGEVKKTAERVLSKIQGLKG